MKQWDELDSPTSIFEVTRLGASSFRAHYPKYAVVDHTELTLTEN
jgi:hypothetical protein